MNNFSISLSLLSQVLQELLCWNSQSLTIWWGFKIWTEFSECNQLLLQGLHHSNASVGALWQAIVVKAGPSALQEKPLNGISCWALQSPGNAEGMGAVVIIEYGDQLWPSDRASICTASKKPSVQALLALLSLRENQTPVCTGWRSRWRKLLQSTKNPLALAVLLHCSPWGRSFHLRASAFSEGTGKNALWCQFKSRIQTVRANKFSCSLWGTSPAQSTLWYTNRLWEKLNEAFPFLDAKG